MAAFAGEVSVFADTNLGTRVAMNVPQDITAGAFKRDFERVHFTCLPNSGEIQVNGLMVKRKSCFYYLPDSLPIKYVFRGTKRTWFIHVEVKHIKNLCIPCSPQSLGTLLEPQDLMTCNIKEKARGNNEEKRMEGIHPQEYSSEEHCNALHISKKAGEISSEHYMQNAPDELAGGCSLRFEKNLNGIDKNPSVMPESECEHRVGWNAATKRDSLSEISTEVISVTGIINKYFSSFDEIDNLGSPSHSDVTSRAAHNESKDHSKTRRRRQIDSLPQFSPKTPLNVLRTPLHVDSVSKNSGDKSRCKVGKCLLVASQSFGLSTNRHRPTISLCRFKDGKLLENKKRLKGSLFEISDSDD